MEEKKNSQSVEAIIESISKLSVLELAELVKALEEKFGVSPTVMATPAASVSTEEPQEEKSSYNLVLTDAGANKIAVIKSVREVNQALGLKEAKDLVEGAPAEILKEVKKEEAEEAKKKLEAAGAKVELK
ncbi:50S ribosomal protein L7/L12 [Candidatus Shapirobacteria bacterium]|nr:50S ribosomal protein L7/L12 [Candidatus Shapirobacteria bacterium]